MHQIVCRLGFAPDPTGELTALPMPPSWFREWGPRGKGRREGKGWRVGEGGRVGERKERRGGERKGKEGVPECPNPELASLILNVGPGPPPAPACGRGPHGTMSSAEQHVTVS